MTRSEYLSQSRLYAKRGSELPHAKLDAAKVREIRRNRNGLTLRQLADAYGVHFRTIEKCHYFETWAHVR